MLMILPHPIFAAHDHQPVEHRIVPATDVAVAPFFKGPNGVSPEGVIIVEVIKGLVLPGIDIEDVRATHTPMLLVPRVAQIDSLPIKIQNPACQGSVNKA